MENLSHRECWFRLFVSFDASKRTSTTLLHGLLPRERKVIESRLEDQDLHPFSLHPLFVPVLVTELMFLEAKEQLSKAFVTSIHVYVAADLHINLGYKHLKDKNLDIEKASEDCLRHEQNILILFEKIETNIKITARLMTWFSTFDTTSMTAFHRKRFESADAILRARLKYLMDGFEFQLVRLKRAHGHTQLNRLGVLVPVSLSSA